MDWPAPAKLNLFLHVTGRRPDGFHELQTVFQFLDVADRLRFEVTHDGLVRRDLSDGLPPEDLTVRAARLLKETAGTAAGVMIRLDKRLPLGAGLGGGSSDAATTLIALNQLWGLHWPRQRLLPLALRLGADVPVFVAGEAAWAEGVGERLSPIALPAPWYVVVVAPVHVGTATVFGAPDLTRDSPPIRIRDFHAGRTRNDLAAVVRRLYPAVDQVFAWLSGYGAPRLTGSGAGVFVAFPDEAVARAVALRCPAPWQALVGRGLNRHPLLADRRSDHWGVAKR